MSTPFAYRLREALPNASAEFLRLNGLSDPTRMPATGTETAIPSPYDPQPAKRLKQSAKPRLNRLETDFLAWMRQQYPALVIRDQAKRYELGNGIWLKPDFTALVDGKETAWETKGKWVDGDSFGKLKVAARVWPEVNWFLVWRKKNSLSGSSQWCFQKVLA